MGAKHFQDWLWEHRAAEVAAEEDAEAGRETLGIEGRERET